MPYAASGTIVISAKTKEDLKAWKEDHESWDQFFQKVLILIERDSYT